MNNEYVVIINSTKRRVSLQNNITLSIDDKKKEVEFKKINDFSYWLRINNEVFEITLVKESDNSNLFLIKGYYYNVELKTSLQERTERLLKDNRTTKESYIVTTPIPGLVIKSIKNKGDIVEQGDPLIVIEAMKMENEIRAPHTGKIKRILVKAGDLIEKNQTIAIIE